MIRTGIRATAALAAMLALGVASDGLGSAYSGNGGRSEKSKPKSAHKRKYKGSKAAKKASRR